MDDSVGASGPGERRWLPWLILVLGLGVALRLWVVLTTATHVYPDSPAYVALAHWLARLDLSADNGARTPFYPLFLLALRYDPDRARLAQMLLGLAITAALFWILWTLTHRRLAAVLGSALYGLSLTQIKYESGLLTETPTTFLLVMLAATLTWLWVDRTRHLATKITVAGLCAGLVPLARPVYAFIPVFVLAAALLWVPRSPRRWALLAVLVVIAFAPMLAWSSFNYARFGAFELTTMAGFDLTNKTGTYIQDAPSEYAAIRDIYVTALKANGGNHKDLIWHVVEPMTAATGQSYPELSRTMLRMNTGLILSHQKEYWANVAVVFAQFWKVDSYEEILPPLAGVTRASWFAYKWFGRLLNLVFLILAAFWVFRAIARRRWPRITPIVWMAAVALVAGMLCALVIDGSNSRFGMPTQPYVVCAVLVAVFSHARARGRSPSSLPESHK